ncbi:MAG: GIN domain-containing protein, partial [Flavobacteriaceae bacterium]
MGESYVIPEVFTNVKNNTLLLSTSNNVKFFENAIERTQLIVTTKDISEIYVLGSAKVSSTTSVESKYLSLELIGSGEISLPIESQNVSLDITGSGNVDLKGNCKIIKGKVIGSGILHTSQLKSKKSFIKIVGSRQASVCSSEKLHASINGTADVTYVGEPKEVDITTWLG